MALAEELYEKLAQDYLHCLREDRLLSSVFYRDTLKSFIADSRNEGKKGNPAAQIMREYQRCISRKPSSDAVEDAFLLMMLGDKKDADACRIDDAGKAADFLIGIREVIRDCGEKYFFGAFKGEDENYDLKKLDTLLGGYFSYSDEWKDEKKTKRRWLEGAEIFCRLPEKEVRDNIKEDYQNGIEDGENLRQLMMYLVYKYIRQVIPGKFGEHGILLEYDKKSSSWSMKRKEAKIKDDILELIDAAAEKGLIGGNGGPGKDECLQLYLQLLKKGWKRDRSSDDPAEWEKAEYEKVFVPLKVDRTTGVSFCIVGREHYKEDIESAFPCFLAVMELRLWGTGGKANIAYQLQQAPMAKDVAKYDVIFPKDGIDRLDPESDAFVEAVRDYYRDSELVYLDLIRRLPDEILRDLNSLTKVPEEIRKNCAFFEKYFTAEKIEVGDADRKAAAESMRVDRRTE